MAVADGGEQFAPFVAGGGGGGEVHVLDHQVHRFALQQRQSLRGAGGVHRGDVVQREQHFQRGGDGRVVVDDQDGGHGWGADSLGGRQRLPVPGPAFVAGRDVVRAGSPRNRRCPRRGRGRGERRRSGGGDPGWPRDRGEPGGGQRHHRQRVPGRGAGAGRL